MRRAALLFSLSIGLAYLAYPADTLFGTWKVVRTLHYSPPSTAEKEKKRIGTRFQIADHFQMEGHSCRIAGDSHFRRREYVRVVYALTLEQAMDFNSMYNSELDFGCFSMVFYQDEEDRAIMVNPIWHDTVEIEKVK